MLEGILSSALEEGDIGSLCFFISMHLKKTLTPKKITEDYFVSKEDVQMVYFSSLEMIDETFSLMGNIFGFHAEII